MTFDELLADDLPFLAEGEDGLGLPGLGEPARRLGGPGEPGETVTVLVAADATTDRRAGQADRLRIELPPDRLAGPARRNDRWELRGRLWRAETVEPLHGGSVRIALASSDTDRRGDTQRLEV